MVSKTLDFELDTFIACSAFFGPSSINEIEILPLKGYFPSNWPTNSEYYYVHFSLYLKRMIDKMHCLIKANKKHPTLVSTIVYSVFLKMCMKVEYIDISVRKNGMWGIVLF